MARRDRDAPFARELVEECEAFLEGRLVERLVDIGAPVPAWAWTNLLAHGTPEQLADPPIHGRRPGCALWAWSQGRALLAAEVLDRAAASGTLRTLQREVLVPLELELMSDASIAIGAVRPNRWVSLLQHRTFGSPGDARA
jgi:hypothetical protein